MLNPARKYLTLRSLGAPAVLLSLAMQGVFRGFKDTRTPLYATGKQILLDLFAFPLFLQFIFRLSRTILVTSKVFFLFLDQTIIIHTM